MPAFLNWTLRLLLTNPICMRLVQGGSTRLRHLYLRSGYLAVMIVVLLFVLLESVGGSGALSLRQLASSGANMFEVVSYFQVGLICLLTPVFMAGAIAQEANPRTWEILLTTPLNNMQIVLGNLFGRLFFVLALLFSSLPLFVMTQYFGGVPGSSIFSSYAIAGTSSLVVAAIAVTLSVTRTAGRRAVFIFYIAVVMYLFVTAAIDMQLRVPIGMSASVNHTTLMTPLNPFLALEVLLHSNTYVPHDFVGTDASWLTKAWLGQPIRSFVWLGVGLSLAMVAYCTLRLRVIGARVGQRQWWRKLFGQKLDETGSRPARTVGQNPISWRESHGKANTTQAAIGRWGFFAAGVTLAAVIIGLFHGGVISLQSLQMALATTLAAEVVIISLVALNTSATAVSKEREDGTLDIILTTPIQPGPYISGKLRGLVQFLVPMLLVPTVTCVMIAIYMMGDGLGREGGVMVNNVVAGVQGKLPPMPAVLPEIAIAMPLLLVPFTAFCVIVGLHWSIRSKGTIGSVIAAVGVVLAVAGVFGLCAIPAGENLPFIGGALSAFNPINLVFAEIYPGDAIGGSLTADPAGGRLSVVIGAAVAAGIYTSIVAGMHTTMKKTFMATVRKLAGAT